MTLRRERLPISLGDKSKRLPWLNFAHPGDPLASPLNPLMPDMVDQDRKYVDVEDVILKNVTFADHVGQLFNNSPLTMLYAGDAHMSYLKSRQVADRIASVILASTKQRVAPLPTQVHDMVRKSHTS